MMSDTIAVRSRWLRRLRNVFVGVIAAVALIAVLGFFVVPPVARAQIETLATQALGRQAMLGHVAFNPFTLKATLRDFKLANRDGNQTLLAFDTLEADLSSASLWHRAPVFDALRLIGPRLDLIRNADGTYSISDLVERMLAGPDGPPPRFSLNNIEIENGAISLDDRQHRRSVAATHLALGIPFLSSLPYDAQIHVTPHFEGMIDNAHLALAGDSTTPFADTREATLALDLDGFPLARYVEYVPLPPGVKLKDGALTTRLTLAFVTDKSAPRAMTLSGTARIDHLAVTRPDGSALIAADSVDAKLRQLDLLARSVAVESLAIDKPDIDLRRVADGTLEVERLLFATPGSVNMRTNESPAATPWTYAVDNARIASGTLHLSDASVTPAFDSKLSGIALQARRLASSGAAGTVELAFDSDEGAHFAGSGEVDLAARRAHGHAELNTFHLAKLYPYYSQALDLDVRRGTLDFAGDFELAAAESTTRVVVNGSRATLADLDLALAGERDPLWRVPRVELTGIEFDLSKRNVRIEQALAPQAAIRVVRQADGLVNFQRLVRTSPRTGTPAQSTQPGDVGWQYVIRKISLDRLSAQFDDRVPQPPVKLAIADAKIAAENLSNARNAKGNIDIVARIGASGRLHTSGAIATNPFAGDWRIDARTIDLVPLRPYFEARTNVIVTSGAVGAKGRLTYSPSPGGEARASYSGDVSITDFDSLDRPTSQELARWKSLSISGINATSEPFNLALGTVALDHFFARLIVNPDATLNIQQLLAPSAAQSSPIVAAQTPAAGIATKELPPPTRDELPVSIARITMEEGEVRFSDFFIQPNYSAHLTAVTGSVSALSTTQAGDVELRASVENSAPVEVRGSLNPFARELMLDLTATAKDIDLPPLTPYSAKYAGYGIQKGKLSLEVHYQVANRKLAASNKLVLDQLTFGQHVDSPDATKLPVLLAVALLKDRNGVINLDLPIEGTLDDPKFSIWRVVVQIVVNLITKAATAPFALLSAIAGGGGEQLAYVEFLPGRTEISPAAETKLRSLAKALTERPGLKLDTAGRAVPDVDRDGLKRVALERAIRVQKQKALASQGESAPALDALAVDPGEYPKYLANVYRDANLPDKPRNVLGIAKDIPPNEMEALLLASYRVDNEALSALANERAQTVKQWFTGAGGIPGERVFIVAPKLTADGIQDKGAPTRVDFAIR
jgi:uncharacterized protein involved in outer membrane biogenesis